MKSLEEINAIRKETREKLDLRVNENANTNEKHILVCGGTGCTSSKSPLIIEKLNTLIKENNLNNVRVIQTGCFGLCAKGPIVIVRPEDVFYALVTPDDVEDIINIHIKENKIVERLLCKDIDDSVVKKLDELNFYKKQERIALDNCGKIDPENIDEYIKKWYDISYKEDVYTGKAAICCSTGEEVELYEIEIEEITLNSDVINKNFIFKVTDFIPASSPSDLSTSSVFQPLDSAQRIYILSNIFAQS